MRTFPPVRALTRLSILFAVLVLPAAALATSTSSRVLAPNCNRAQYKPKELTLACNDGSYYLIELRWTSWTAREAAGTGVAKINDCTPDCARGHFHAYRVSVTLSKPQRCAKLAHKIFSHIAELFPNRHPGRSNRQGGPLFCP
jgi:hypothetical protein